MDKWTILVGGYGAFLFDGTEAEAEEMRAHKSRWERGVGIKRPATEAEISSGKADQCWNHPGYNNRLTYVCRHCVDAATKESAHED